MKIVWERIEPSQGRPVLPGIVHSLPLYIIGVTDVIHQNSLYIVILFRKFLQKTKTTNLLSRNG
jgi:hypothetical protein